jgi:long-chain acyl-CoA synthetase
MPDLTPAVADTFPRLLQYHARQRPDAPAVREKDLGIWQTYCFRDALDTVRELALGLSDAGFRRGANLAVIGDNRPHLYWAMVAAQCVGGVALPLYQDAVASEMTYVLQEAEVEFAIVEDQEQVDKLLEILPQCPHLKAIIYDDPRGLRNYRQPELLSIEVLLARGRARAASDPTQFDTEVAAGRSDDVAVMLYTSGTTGRPKGVCQTHHALISAAQGGVALDHFGPGDELLSYLPMAWVGDNLFSFAQALLAGFTINCPESQETVMTDMREIGPTYYFAPPRVFENLLTQVMIRMEDASWAKRRLFHYFMGVARDCGPAILDGHGGVGLHQRLLYALGNLLIYGPLRNVLGMSRVRVAITAGAAIGPDLFRFYRSIGINLKQFYGSTETCAYACMQPDGQVRFETVGPPSPGVEIRIAANGEVLVRSPSLLKEYYRRPDATAEAIDADGFFRTGDAGVIDPDSHIRIIDRAKDVGRLTSGALFAPNYIENKLKFFSYIKEAVSFGAGRDQVCAFINIDLAAVGDWAERRHIAYSGYTDLAQRAEVYELVKDCVMAVNRDLAGDPALADSQIRRFLVLHKELDPDDDELTRTRKVRRAFIAEKYRVLVDALYSDKTSQFIETQVKFEDGRSGVVAAELRIVDVDVPGSLARAA